jgi:hypothetical protein
VSLGLTLSVAYEALVKELRLEIEAKDEEISRLREERNRLSKLLRRTYKPNYIHAIREGIADAKLPRVGRLYGSRESGVGALPGSGGRPDLGGDARREVPMAQAGS